jgi:hypothetical protein
MCTYSVTVEFVGCNLKVSSQDHVCNCSVANRISYEVFAYEHNVVRTKFHLRILIICLLIIAITPEIKKNSWPSCYFTLHTDNSTTNNVFNPRVYQETKVLDARVVSSQ